jgi:Na+/H+ antiporter NhaA
VFVVPFLRTEGEELSLYRFENRLKRPVGLRPVPVRVHAGRRHAGDVGALTWLVLASLVLGKTAGIALFGALAIRLGFPLPAQMGMRELTMVGFVAALGLTVALFVASAAFVDPGAASASEDGSASVGGSRSGGDRCRKIVRLRSEIIGYLFQYIVD